MSRSQMRPEICSHPLTHRGRNNAPVVMPQVALSFYVPRASSRSRNVALELVPVVGITIKAITTTKTREGGGAAVDDANR